MKEFTLNNKTTVKYKESLTEAEYITLIEITIEAYQNGIAGMLDDIGVIAYNPIKAEQAFYRTLLGTVVEDYNVDDYNVYFESGLHKTIRQNVLNAEDAFDMIQQIVKDSLNVSTVINNFLNNIVGILNTKLPEGDKMVKALNKLPKDWTKIFGEFQTITGQEAKENDK